MKIVIPSNAAVDYIEDANALTLEDSVKLSTLLKEGVDVITASAGGFVFLDKSKVYPAYQVPYAEKIKMKQELLLPHLALSILPGKPTILS